MIIDPQEDSSAVQDGLSKFEEHINIDDLLEKRLNFKNRLEALVGEDHTEPLPAQKRDFHWDYVLKESVSLLLKHILFLL